MSSPPENFGSLNRPNVFLLRNLFCLTGCNNISGVHPVQAASCRDSSGRSFPRRIAARIPASTAVPAKFSQIPVSPSGHNRITSTTGKISAVDTEINEAARDFSMAPLFQKTAPLPIQTAGLPFRKKSAVPTGTADPDCRKSKVWVQPFRK